MSSSINEAWPQAGNALTANVRANFLAAKNEIEALQLQVTGFNAAGTTLGVGTTSPDGTLHVHTASAGAVTASLADDLIVENSGSGGISILAPDANLALIAFGSPSDPAYAFIDGRYNGGNPLLQFQISAGIKARFDATSSAGNTALMLYDVDNATLERVTVGAADSGGTNFKVLRIPN